MRIGDIYLLRDGVIGMNDACKLVKIPKGSLVLVTDLSLTDEDTQDGDRCVVVLLDQNGMEDPAGVSYDGAWDELLEPVVVGMVYGAKYWSCRPSIESDSYNGPAYVEPWQGVLHINRGGAIELSRFRLSRFSQMTGRIDDDANATAIIRNASEIFETEGLALAVYAGWCRREAFSLREQADILEDRAHAIFTRERKPCTSKSSS